MLLDFTIHCRQNENTKSKSTHVKTMLVHSAVSCGRLMQKASPLIFFNQVSYNNNSLGTFWYYLVSWQEFPFMEPKGKLLFTEVYDWNLSSASWIQLMPSNFITSKLILSHVWVTTDGVWIGNWI
jgi:hypothetical protein